MVTLLLTTALLALGVNGAPQPLIESDTTRDWSFVISSRITAHGSTESLPLGSHTACFLAVYDMRGEGRCTISGNATSSWLLTASSEDYEVTCGAVCADSAGYTAFTTAEVWSDTLRIAGTNPNTPFCSLGSTLFDRTSYMDMVSGGCQVTVSPDDWWQIYSQWSYSATFCQAVCVQLIATALEGGRGLGESLPQANTTRPSLASVAVAAPPPPVAAVAPPWLFQTGIHEAVDGTTEHAIGSPSEFYFCALSHFYTTFADMNAQKQSCSLGVVDGSWHITASALPTGTTRCTVMCWRR